MHPDQIEEIERTDPSEVAQSMPKSKQRRSRKDKQKAKNINLVERERISESDGKINSLHDDSLREEEQRRYEQMVEEDFIKVLDS